MKEACPFGPELQLYWDMRYQLFSRFDRARVDRTGLYTMVPQALALDMAQRAQGANVLDVCGGVGSMAIAFARAGKRVVSVEIEPGRAGMAQHNAELYGVAGRIRVLPGDITDPGLRARLPANVHTLHYDPPWGAGPGDYIRKPSIKLTNLLLAGNDPREIVSDLPGQEVLMRLPPNFDIGIFRNVAAEKLAYVSRKGWLHFYMVRLSRRAFINLADRSPEGLSDVEAREGFLARYVDTSAAAPRQRY